VGCLSRIEKKTTLYQKKEGGGQKFTFAKKVPIFKPRHLDLPLEKFHFFRHQFSWERNRQSTIKFDIDLDVLLIYRMILRKFGLCESIVFFDTTPISRFLGSSFSVHSDIRHKGACFWVSHDIYALYRGACEI
jgi:hypothetical protein